MYLPSIWKLDKDILSESFKYGHTIHTGSYGHIFVCSGENYCYFCRNI